MAIDVFYQSAQRTIDTDDSVIGVGARKRRVNLETRPRVCFSAKESARAEAAEKSCAVPMICDVVSATSQPAVANAPPTLDGSCFRLLF